MSIDVLGTKSAALFLVTKGTKVISQAQAGIVQATFFIEGEIKKSIAHGTNAPIAFDTGLLSKSPASEIGTLSGKVSSNLEYADEVEYGTTRMSARPHFRNSLSKNKMKIIAFVQSKIAQI